jgi:hypothetical protein
MLSWKSLETILCSLVHQPMSDQMYKRGAKESLPLIPFSESPAWLHLLNKKKPPFPGALSSFSMIL